MNAHVILYKTLLLRRAQHYKKQLAQWLLYTELMLEIDPSWSPYK